MVVCRTPVLKNSHYFVFPATKMFRFNEGDVADDAAAYLLAIKESVCQYKIFSHFRSFCIFCFDLCVLYLNVV
jgi:hypothetical protein